MADDSGNTINVLPTVHLVPSKATILSGSVGDCLSADDETCTGGIAGARHYMRLIAGDEPSLLLPWADLESPVSQLNSFGVALNLLVYYLEFGYRVFLASEKLIAQSVSLEARAATWSTFSDLQDEDFPVLMSNVAPPPTNSWARYTKNVHFDEATRLAVLHIASEEATSGLSYSQVDSATELLRAVAKLNAKHGCGFSQPPVAALWDVLQDFYDSTYGTNATFDDEVYNDTFYDVADYGFADNVAAFTCLQAVNRTAVYDYRSCWIPIIIYDDVTGDFESFLRAMATFDLNCGDTHPRLIVDVNGLLPEYSEPGLIGGLQETWVVSQVLDSNTYSHLKLQIGDDGRSLANVEADSLDLSSIIVRDAAYENDLEILSVYANNAMEYNWVIVESEAMPAAEENGVRLCNLGECEIGNLFTDGIRYDIGAQLSFLPSSHFTGPGWPAGDVFYSKLFEMVPVSADVCTGTVTGISLFRILDYSFSEATFEGVNTPEDGALLQVSGMRLVYNAELSGSRIIAIDIWDESTESYEPIDRLKLYTFATDSSVCTAEPYRTMLTTDLILDGEKPAEVLEWWQIQGEVNYALAVEYLGLGIVYVPQLEGRLQNDSAQRKPLNLLQSDGDCVVGETYWAPELVSCLECPPEFDVLLSNSTVEFTGQSFSQSTVTKRLLILNNEPTRMYVSPKRTSVPSWVTIMIPGGGQFTSALIEAGGNTTLEFVVDPSTLEAGTARSSLSFELKDGGSRLGCAGPDISVEVLARLTPRPTTNNLGAVAAFGFATTAIIVLTAVGIAIWVQRNRKARVVLAMQPKFLMAICFGVLLLGSASVTMSIDDGLVSVRGCDIACRATPWLLSLGFTIAMAALFSKLWRINKLFRQTQFRRVQIHEKDVLLPFIIVFTLNVAFLLTWTFADPLTWQRVEVDGQSWNTYGFCDVGSGRIGRAMFGLLAGLNALCLIAACWQAFLARNISGEFSESKYIGIAIFSWVQLLLVGIPVLFLIDNDNAAASYSLIVALLFAVCMSMLLVIFVPMVYVKIHGGGGESRVKVSGLEDSKLSAASDPTAGQHVSADTVGSGLHSNSPQNTSELEAKPETPVYGDFSASQPESFPDDDPLSESPSERLEV